MFRDFACEKRNCKEQVLDYFMDILDPWPRCPKCHGEMKDISFQTARVAIKGKGYTKEGIR